MVKIVWTFDIKKTEDLPPSSTLGTPSTLGTFQLLFHY